MGVEDVVRSEASRDVEVPDRVSRVPTMLSPDEIRLLYALARDGYEGRGRIVDAGCFLGGSTVALAQGLRDAGHTTAAIDVYDRFTAERYTLAEHWFEGRGMKVGDSFRPMFDEHLTGLEDLLDVHEGDITRQAFDQPIEILFLDVLKTWPVNDAVTDATFRKLVPGAVVVQQDWGSGTLPWLTLTMERLADHFDVICDIGPSRVFVLTDPISDALLGVRRIDLDPTEMVAMYDRVIDRLDGTARGLQLLNKVQLLLLEVGIRPGLALLRGVEGEYADDPAVMAEAGRLRGYFPAAVLPLAAAVRGGRQVVRAVHRISPRAGR